MFFGKPKMDEAERIKWDEEILQLINANKMTEAYEKTLEFEKLDRDAAGYHMSYFYIMGECVRENQKEALKRLEKYVRRVPEDSEGWLRCGLIKRATGDVAGSLECFGRAEDLGNLEAKKELAITCKIIADENRNTAAGTLNVKEYAEKNSMAVSLYIRSMALFHQVAEKRPKLIGDAEWQGYGRAADMMYILSLNGEVKKINSKDKAIQSYLEAGAQIMQGKASVKEQLFWRRNAVEAYHQMDQNGYGVMAEYFRASLCLNDCSEKKNQAMFSNAKWHMERAKELYGNLNQEQKKEYPDDFSDILALYEKMEKKYGKITDNRLRAGEYPALYEEYIPGAAPEIEDCKRFADYLNSLSDHTAVQQETVNATEKKKKGLFGLFK